MSDADDALMALYEERIAPARERYNADLRAAEARAAEGVARDLDGLRGVHGDVIAFIEGRWLRWLDANVDRCAARYNDEAARIRREVFGA